MDNWVIFILGLVLGIPFSIFANFATPWVKSYFKKSSLSYRERRLYVLLKRYKNIKDHRENPTQENTLFHMSLITGIVITITLIFLNTLKMDLPSLMSTLASGVVIIFTIVGIFPMYYLLKFFGDIYTFETYRKKVIKKYEKLGGNPEDLDKEEDE